MQKIITEEIKVDTDGYEVILTGKAHEEGTGDIVFYLDTWTLNKIAAFVRDVRLDRVKKDQPIQAME